MYLQAIKRPFSNKKKLIWAAMLSSIPIINWFFLGYLYECAITAYVGNQNLPKWRNYRRLFMNGFKIFIVSLIYMIPVYILLITAATFYLTFDDVLGLPIYLVCFFIIYLIPIALLNFILNENLTLAFKGVFKKAVNWLYFKTILKLLLLLIPYLLLNLVIGLIFFSLLANVDWLMFLLSSFFSLVVIVAYQITMFTILAKVYRKL